MSALANPTRRNALLEPEAVSHHRCLYCPEYDGCLEVAASSGWPSWSCEKCPLARWGARSEEAFLQACAAA